MTTLPPCGMLPLSGWVRRGGNLRTPSGPRGSSGKQALPGAAGVPAWTFYLISEFQRRMHLVCLPAEQRVLGEVTGLVDDLLECVPRGVPIATRITEPGFPGDRFISNLTG